MLFHLRSYIPELKQCFWVATWHVMMHTLEKEEEPWLPYSLSVVNTYTEMTTRSR